MNDDLKGYCIFYADTNGNRDVTFFGPILTNIIIISGTGGSGSYVRQAQP